MGVILDNNAWAMKYIRTSDCLLYCSDPGQVTRDQQTDGPANLNLRIEF